jgi:sigma-B regulation protein RsbU (phosphoserine phosphatase)
MRQVKFPLKLKLLALMIILIAASLMIFLGIALKTFREDKSAYIYESMLNKAASDQLILSQKLGDGSFIFRDNELSYAGKNTDEILSQQLSVESSYQLKVVVPSQGQFYEWKDKSLSLIKGEEKEILKEFTRVNQAVKEISLKGEKLLYAYDYNPEANFIYVVALAQEKAYSATKYLINKSIFYGLFILGISMMVSVLLSKPLTAQLETLFGMTQEIAKGNFHKRVQLKGHDEVGALSDSVNDMADKIVVFMEEMKEKTRLENEVMVAQLVQSSFFPGEAKTDEALSTHGHFEPASECGGDWWGFVEQGEWHVFFIADATGHGVPAALLTATINCCKSSLAFIAETRPDILSRPDEILRYMNQAVSGAGKEIQVTCFVASLNKKTKTLIFANSSQTPPLLFPSGRDELTKNDFRPLIEANGPRLGQHPEARFEAFTIQLSPKDTLFFYTDGLTEAENNEGNAFGQRRLIKSLLQHGREDARTVVEGVVADFKEFTSQKVLNDDLTVVTMRVLS